MRRTEALQGVRMAMFLNLLHRWESAELNQEEAAELLGVDVRTFRRWTRRYEEEGEAGLVNRRLGKASGGRVPVDRAEEVERLYRERHPASRQARPRASVSAGRKLPKKRRMKTPQFSSRPAFRAMPWKAGRLAGRRGRGVHAGPG